MNHPDAKKHQLISFVKSAIRIGGGILSVTVTTEPQHAVFILAVSFVVAELIGIYEELV